MLKIACANGIASTMIPDANALVADNRPLNLLRLHGLLHQLATQPKEKKNKNQ